MIAEYKVSQTIDSKLCFFHLVYIMLPVSLDGPFLIAPWIFSNVYLDALTV
jgi:hypothetical protein